MQKFLNSGQDAAEVSRRSPRGKRECTADAFSALHSDVASLSLDDVLDDSQAQAGPFIATGTVNLVEPLEYVRDVFGSNARSGIANRYQDIVARG